MELYKAIKEFRDINSDNDNSDDEDDSKAATELRKKKLEEIKSLLANSDIEKVNKIANDGYTPLYAAVEIGDIDVVKLLLAKRGIDVNQPTRDGKTPLHFAIMTDNIKVVESLLAHPDIVVNQNGNTFLYILTMRDKPKMMKLLLEKSDIDVNQPTMDGNTPLYTAAEIGKTVALNLLLAHPRIDVNKSKDGNTPFDIAIINDKIPIINLFLTYNTQLKSNISLARKSKTYVLPNELWDLVSTYGNTPAKFHTKNLIKLKKLVSMSIPDNIKDFILDPSASASASASAGGKSKKKIKKYKKYKKSKTVKKYYIKKRKL